MFEKNQASLSKENIRILMIEMNRIIERIADEKARLIISGKIETALVYPPNNGFSSDEIKSIKNCITNDEVTLHSFRKIIADSIACGFFDFLNLIDGTGDPECNTWNQNGVCIIDKDDLTIEENEMLHDSLYEYYWEWKKIRNEKWKLDTIEE